jgi:O-succinylhomoserine sulfhydrylase
VQDGRATGFALLAGMAAVYSTMAALLEVWNHMFLPAVFLAHTFVVYHFPKWNIETSYFDINKPETIEVSSP